MSCAECVRLQDDFRLATRAYTLAVGQLTKAKRTPDFPAAVDNSTEAKRAMTLGGAPIGSTVLSSMADVDRLKHRRSPPATAGTLCLMP